jgi:hypothetical protein
MSEGPEEQRERVAAELRRVRDAASATPVPARPALEVLPSPRPASAAGTGEPLPDTPPRAPEPRRPDNVAVNELWPLPVPHPPRGLAGRLYGFFTRLLSPLLDAQRQFNSRQVQLDNETLDYIDQRFDRTHAHYDRVLGDYGRQIRDIDERHLILQNELVAHVHDLVQRIDLVLAESERGRASLDAALRDVRSRLARLEEQLAAARPNTTVR